MSKDLPTRHETLALLIPCQRCGARADEWCIHYHGWAKVLHKPRTFAAQRIYEAGARDAERALQTRPGPA